MHQFYSALQYVIAILTYAPCLPCRLFAALTLLAYSLTCCMPFKARVFPKYSSHNELLVYLPHFST